MVIDNLHCRRAWDLLIRNSPRENDLLLVAYRRLLGAISSTGGKLARMRSWVVPGAGVLIDRRMN